MQHCQNRNLKESTLHEHEKKTQKANCTMIPRDQDHKRVPLFNKESVCRLQLFGNSERAQPNKISSFKSHELSA